MPKIDVSITRSITINTGNYESIKPTVTLTVRDIDPETVSDAYLSMEEIISGLLKLEILFNAGESKKISDGLDVYCRNVLSNQEEIGATIEKSLEELNKF